MGILHVAFNMLAFVPIASSLERTQGSILLAHLLIMLTVVGDVVFVILSYALSYWWGLARVHLMLLSIRLGREQSVICGSQKA